MWSAWVLAARQSICPIAVPVLSAIKCCPVWSGVFSCYWWREATRFGGSRTKTARVSTRESSLKGRERESWREKFTVSRAKAAPSCPLLPQVLHANPHLLHGTNPPNQIHTLSLRLLWGTPPTAHCHPAGAGAGGICDQCAATFQVDDAWFSCASEQWMANHIAGWFAA